MMSRFISAIAIVFVICSVQCTSGYKWIPLRANDTIPITAIKLSDNPIKYVGRAIHYNVVLPAEIYNTTYALIKYQDDILVKRQFEVLVATEHCEWTDEFYYTKEIPQNVVHAGSAWNGEPIYIGRTTTSNDSARIASILFGSDRFEIWDGHYYSRNALICNDNTTWVDATAQDIPRNAVYGGKWNGMDWDFYVARLLADVSFIPGIVTREQNITSVRYGEYTIESFYCQVLINDQYQYIWYPVSDSRIPDYAVIGGRAANGELRYVARQAFVTYIVHSEIPPYGRNYEMLVKNVG